MVDQLMIDNWQGRVKEKDTILHLGDLIMGRNSDYFDWLAELPGQKFLVMGNHDNRKPEWYKKHRFTVIEPFSLTYNGVEVSFSHYPIRTLRRAQISVFGHCHNNPVNFLTSSHINMSVELRHFCPQDVKYLINKIIQSFGRSGDENFGPIKKKKNKGAIHS